MTPGLPRILPVGDTAVTIDFGNVISVAINRRVHALAAAIDRANLAGVIEVVPTYRSVTVHCDPLLPCVDSLNQSLQELLAYTDGQDSNSTRRWRVPVVFGGEFGQDLQECAAMAGFEMDAYVDAFVAPVYRVMMIGFLPGFSYLAGLPEQLSRPRRATPRAKIPAGSISIGGQQAAIGSMEGPSGWHVLGRTPAIPFLVGRDPLFLLNAGDEVRMVPTPEAEWHTLAKAAAGGASVVLREDMGRAP